MQRSKPKDEGPGSAGAFNIVVVMVPAPGSNEETPPDLDTDPAQWQDEEGDYLIWPENWATWLAFLELGDQWEMIGAQGFYYQGIPVERIDRVLARTGMSAEDEQEAYGHLRAMAAVAKPELNRKLREATAK